jgi:hypothetical protein
MNYVDTSKVSVSPISKSVANDMIIKYHYSHTKTLNKYSFGIFYNVDNEFIDDNKKLIGTVIFGSPVGRLTVKSISPLLEKGQVLELTRLFIHDGFGSNIESYSIARCLEWIKKNDPNVKVIITYADPEAGHKGTIYQALNFLYQGSATRIVDGFWYKFPDSKKWYHPRTVVGMFGSVSKKILLSHYPQGYLIKELRRKHRYILFICNKKDKKSYMKTLKHPILEYPKDEENHKVKIIKVKR